MKKLLILSALFLLFVPCRSYCASVTLAWDPNTETDLAGYNIFYGLESRVYTQSIDVGNVVEFTIDGLDENATYYYAATAYDTDGNESDYSDELVHVISGVTTTTTTTTTTSTTTSTSSTTTTTTLPYPVEGFVECDSDTSDHECKDAYDTNASTYWITQWSFGGFTQRWIKVDIGEIKNAHGFLYTPRQDNQTGRINEFQVCLSLDGTEWTCPVIDDNTFNNSTDVQSRTFQPTTAKFLRLTALSSYGYWNRVAISEILVLYSDEEWGTPGPTINFRIKKK